VTAGDPVLIVAVDNVARRLGLELPLSTDNEWLVTQAIIDAQAAVEGYLGRGLTPATYTETGLWPPADGASWCLTNGPVVSIVSATVDVDTGGHPTGIYTVVYTAGIDAANDPALLPIRQYVTAAAVNSPVVLNLWRADQPNQGRTIRNLSTEGQSVGYADATPLGVAKAGEPGSLPNIATLDRWKLAGRRVFQRQGGWGWP
jgi:hypothetical protein